MVDREVVTRTRLCISTCVSVMKEGIWNRPLCQMECRIVELHGWLISDSAYRKCCTPLVTKQDSGRVLPMLIQRCTFFKTCAHDVNSAFTSHVLMCVDSHSCRTLSSCEMLDTYCFPEEWEKWTATLVLMQKNILFFYKHMGSSQLYDTVWMLYAALFLPCALGPFVGQRGKWSIKPCSEKWF